MKNQFIEIKKENAPHLNVIQATTDPNALHVLLFSLNTPYHHIMFDGEKYWLFSATSRDGWERRIEYKGSTDYLIIAGSYVAPIYAEQWDFKVRDIPEPLLNLKWGKYLKQVSNNNS